MVVVFRPTCGFYEIITWESEMTTELKEVPGFIDVYASKDGRIFANGKEYLQKKWGDRYYVYLPERNNPNKYYTPVHRLVALAFCKGKTKERRVVNHRDGNPLNNNAENLEWVTYSENNRHAVRMGLRKDNRPVKMRHWQSGKIMIFHSQADALKFLGIACVAGSNTLFLKMFGRLHGNDEWEIKDLKDTSPWFYEDRTEKVAPNRYWFIVTDENGVSEETFGVRDFIKKYKLWNITNNARVLIKVLKERRPNLSIVLLDSYEKEVPTSPFRTALKPISATKENETIQFKSLRKCARHFSVDRSVIKNRIKTGNDLNGWHFEIARRDMSKD